MEVLKKAILQNAKHLGAKLPKRMIQRWVKREGWTERAGKGVMAAKVAIAGLEMVAMVVTGVTDQVEEERVVPVVKDY